jgi:hypothetical protein
MFCSNTFSCCSAAQTGVRARFLFRMRLKPLGWPWRDLHTSWLSWYGRGGKTCRRLSYWFSGPCRGRRSRVKLALRRPGARRDRVLVEAAPSTRCSSRSVEEVLVAAVRRRRLSRRCSSPLFVGAACRGPSRSVEVRRGGARRRAPSRCSLANSIFLCVFHVPRSRHRIRILLAGPLFDRDCP